jgi:nucleoside-diphosphate-sugar epimerase
MHLLITSAASPLAQTLADLLAEDHTIRLTERTRVQSDHEFVLSQLGHDASTNLLVRGMDAIVHVASEPLDMDASAQIDWTTRGIYNLLHAAAAEGVGRIVYLSSLALMMPYDENFLVDERWRPLPQPQPPTLTTYLGESVCREFAREHKLTVVVLRLAHVVHEDDPPVAPWIDVRDVAQAIQKALTADLDRWSIYHIASTAADPRFSIAKAQTELGFAPQVNG